MTENTQAETASPSATAIAPDAATSPGPKRSGAIVAGFFGGLLGGTALALVIAAGVTVTWPQARNFLIPQDQDRDAQLTETIAGLQRRIAALESQPAAAPDATPPQLAAAQQKADQASADVTRLSADVDALRRAIPPEGVILRLADRAEQAEKVARAIANQHANAQALLLVAGQLREAVNNGDPFEVELKAARKVAPAEIAALLDGLNADAPQGIPRKTVLLDQFGPLANDIVRAQISPDQDGFVMHAWRKLAGLVNVRRTDGLGDDPASVVARAEAEVKAGDLGKAAQELTHLSGAPADTAALWQKAALARANADRLMSQFSAQAAALTAKDGQQ